MIYFSLESEFNSILIYFGRNFLEILILSLLKNYFLFSNNFSIKITQIFIKQNFHERLNCSFIICLMLLVYKRLKGRIQIVKHPVYCHIITKTMTSTWFWKFVEILILISLCLRFNYDKI